MTQGLRSVDDRNFDQTIETAGVPVLVEFWKPGCGHCRALTMELNRLQEEAGSTLLVVAMNTEENHQIPAELEVTSLPALALFQNGEFKRFIGGIGKKEEILKQLAHDEP
jgi:thioredoxin 1